MYLSDHMSVSKAQARSFTEAFTSGRKESLTRWATEVVLLEIVVGWGRTESTFTFPKSAPMSIRPCARSLKPSPFTTLKGRRSTAENLTHRSATFCFSTLAISFASFFLLGVFLTCWPASRFLDSDSVPLETDGDADRSEQKEFSGNVAPADDGTGEGTGEGVTGAGDDDDGGEIINGPPRVEDPGPDPNSPEPF